VPATCAIIDGNVHVGLDDYVLERLANDDKAIKTSRRDFPYVVANKLCGGTTVSGTLVISAMAGIEIFVTGGIGGVHRGATETMDVSADLTELGRSPVGVVCAGVKSILDIGLTLEYLETQGVCVTSMRPDGSRSFPSFYSRDSGHMAPYNVASPREAARLMQARQQLDLKSGIVIGVPLPESEAAAGHTIEAAVQDALALAAAKGVSGRDITPFVLAKLSTLTGGKSLKSNLALVENNALHGARIAVELALLRNAASSTVSSSSSTANTSSKTSTFKESENLIVVGGCNYDFVARLSDSEVSLNGGTASGSLRSSPGGVGLNFALALSALSGNKPILVSAIGKDNHGDSILRSLEGKVCTEFLLRENKAATATYVALLDSAGDCKLGVGDMKIHGCVSPEYVDQHESLFTSAPLLVLDGNMREDTIDSLLCLARKHSIPLFFDPADVSKACKPLRSSCVAAMTMCSPNLQELKAMVYSMPRHEELALDLKADCEESVRSIAEAATSMMNFYKLKTVIVTLGESGVLLMSEGSGTWYRGTKLTPSMVVSASGAGDCFSAAFIIAHLKGASPKRAVAAGMQAAHLSLVVSEAVPHSLQPHSINWEKEVEGVLVLPP